MLPQTTSPWLETVPDQRRFAPLQRSISADVVVIGGGIVGLMTAWNLAAQGRSVVVVEKNHVATGDSGLTTAFLTRVPDTAAADLLKSHGSQWLTRLFAATKETQRWFRDLVRQESIACDLVDCVSYNCSYEATDAGLRNEWEAIRQVNADAAFVAGAEAARSGVTGVRDAIRFDAEARFHIRKFLFGLLDRPTGRRIQVFEETEVTGVQVDGGVTAQSGAGSVHCQSVVCATGLPAAPFAELRGLVTPVLTFAIAARYQGAPPMSDSLFWDTSDPYQYYRLFDGHTVILGGCDRPAAGPAAGESAHAKLKSFLATRLPGPFEVTHEWSGTLFESADGLPYVAEHPHYPGRVFVATGFGGNGMVMGTLAGRILADLATGSKNAHAALFEFSRTGVSIPKPDRPAEAPARGFFGKLFGSAKPPATPPAHQFVPALKVADVTPARPRAVKVKGHEIAFFNIGGTVHAIENTCSHAGGPLCDGKVDGAVVTCPYHGSKFDVTTGAVRGGPASLAQKPYTVRVSGDMLEVEV